MVQAALARVGLGAGFVFAVEGLEPDNSVIYREQVYASLDARPRSQEGLLDALNPGSALACLLMGFTDCSAQPTDGC